MANREESRTDLGVVKIHKNSIASIAAIAALEVEGVKSLAKGFASGIKEAFGKKDAGAIKVEFDKNAEVSVEIPLVILYTYNIPEVAGKVQENVRASLEKMTSLSIKDISINVSAIEKRNSQEAPR